MAFDRLQALGDEQFHKILNLLMRGEPAMALARTIQQPPPKGWGLFQDVAEKTLTQQLNRLRMEAAEGAFGMKRAREIAEGAKPKIGLLKNVSVQVLTRLEELSDIQQARIVSLVEKEKDIPKGGLPIVNDTAREYRQLLLDIQKVRFDLGLDEFKGPVQGIAVRGATQTTSLPDGTNIQKQVFEAVTTVERIFEERKIPQLPRGN